MKKPMYQMYRNFSATGSRSRPNWGYLFAISTLCSLCFLASVCLPVYADAAKTESFDLPHLSQKPLAPTPERPSQAFPSFTYAASRAVQAVVHIKACQKEKIVQREFSHPLEQLLNNFLGEHMHMKPRQFRKPAQEASGSGVIYHEKGYIITNNHVIEGADTITVTLNDNRCYEAKLLDADPSVDLAVLKIEASELTCLQFGNSDALEVGEWVLAVGNPFNLNSTVTKGVVSAKSRDLNHQNFVGSKMTIRSFIQTDAAINQGNSGGALVNLCGELVGINTAIATSSFVGYGFAIPSSLVRKVANDVFTYGVVQRVVLLGVETNNVNATLAKELKLQKIGGVYVNNVQKGSPYAKYLRKNDVIISINRHVVNKESELQEFIACSKPGDEITVELYREGKCHNIAFLLQKGPGAVSVIEKSQTVEVEGVTFQDIDAKRKQKLQIESGVLVKELSKGKFQEAGLKRGHIVLALEKNPVHNIKELAQLLRQANEAVLVKVFDTSKKSIYYIAVNLD